MRKKLYEKPAMRIVKLQQQTQLLQASVTVESATWEEEEDI